MGDGLPFLKQTLRYATNKVTGNTEKFVLSISSKVRIWSRELWVPIWNPYNLFQLMHGFTHQSLSKKGRLSGVAGFVLTTHAS